MLQTWAPSAIFPGQASSGVRNQGALKAGRAPHGAASLTEPPQDKRIKWRGTPDEIADVLGQFRKSTFGKDLFLRVQEEFSRCPDEARTQEDFYRSVLANSNPWNRYKASLLLKGQGIIVEQPDGNATRVVLTSFGRQVLGLEKRNCWTA